MKVSKLFSAGAGAVIIAVICNVLWGSAYPGIKLGYAAFSVGESWANQLLFAGMRFCLAGALVLAVAAVKDKSFPKISRGNLFNVGLTAVVYTAVQYIFFYIGLGHTTGSNGSIVNSTTTFIAVILSYFVYKEKITLAKAAGCVIGFAGVMLAAGGSASFSFKGEGFIFLAAICFVVGGMISKKATAIDSAINVTGWNLLIGGVILTVTGLLSGGKLPSVTWGGIGALLYLAFLSSAAFTLWNTLLKYQSLSRIAVYNFIIPVTGTFLSALFLHEDIWKPKYLAALVLVCAGIVITNREKKSVKI